jgi:hypothetical protein
MLVMASVPFTKTHDMTRLSDLATPHYSHLHRLFANVAEYTVWGYAYRYPGLEEAAEPEPSQDQLCSALAAIKRLADHLRSLIAST